MSAFAILAASGSGQRMRLPSSKNKLFLNLGGYPLIYHSLKILQESKWVKSIIVPTMKVNISKINELVKKYKFSKVEKTLEGGKERDQSIYNAISHIAENHTFKKKNVILIHDAARPFTTLSEVSAIVKTAQRSGAVVPITKSKNTIKRIKNDFIINTIDRKTVVNVHTPQAFNAELIWNAYKKMRLKMTDVTDDSSFIEKCFPNQKIHCIETSYENIKITTPEDIIMARIILKTRSRNSK